MKTFRTLAKLLDRIVKNAFHLSRGTLWRKHCWLLEINSTLGREIFGFAPENFQDCCHMSNICFQMANWKNVSAKNFTFLFFLGPPGNFFWFFRWVILQMVVKTAFFMPKTTYAIRKTFWQNFFLSFSDYEGYFLRLPLRYLMLGCQKYRLRVQRITLRKVMFFWDFFKIVFGLWAIIVQTSGKNFQQRCQNCIPRVQRTSRFSLQ